MQDLEKALGMSANQNLPRVPSIFLGGQQKALKKLRKRFLALSKRHEERCEALYYGLGIVDGSDAYRAPAELRHSRDQPHSSVPDREASTDRENSRDQIAS